MERRSTTRALLSLVAAALLTLLVSACGGGDASDASGGGGQGGNAQPAALTNQQLGELPEATTFGNLKGAPADPSPDDTSAGENGTGTVLHPKQAVAVYAEPGGDPFAKLPRRQISSPTWVPVIEERGDWAHILLPARPNGSSGWVYTGDDSVETASNDFSVTVNRDDFSLEIRENGKKTGEWTIGIGSDEHPTPKGRAYIIASIEEQVNDYSPIVLPLSTHSDSHETYGGGPGTVGIHTWPDESFVGQADSDGCLRVTQEALDALVKLPLGTMVEIV